MGKFLSVDPLTNEYPELTPYQFASNRPIDGIDLDGLEYMDHDKVRIKAKNGTLYFQVENMVDIYQKQIKTDDFALGNFSVLKYEFSKSDPYSFADSYDPTFNGIRSGKAGRDPAAYTGLYAIMEFYKNNRDANSRVPMIEGRYPVYGVGSFIKIHPSELGVNRGGKATAGRGAIGGSLAALTLAIEVNNGINGFNAFWDITEEQQQFKLSVRNLREATNDVFDALVIGNIVPVKLATKEGLSALTTYVLGGRLETWSNERTGYENSLFLLDVKNTGDRIIQDVSSKKETYKKR